MSRTGNTFILLLTAAVLSVAAAQGAVSVQPNAVIHPATPGAVLSQVLRLDNPGDGALDISIYPGDWQYDSSGQIVYYPAGTLERSAATWLSFDRDSLHVEAHSNAEVTYTVSVPPDAAPGSYWAALFAEGTEPETDEAGPAPLTTFRLRTAHMIYVNVPPSTGGGRITGMLGHVPVSEDAPYTMQLTYLNEGNTVQILRGEIQIRSVTGELIDTVQMDRHMALPGITRTFNVSVFGPIPAGNYLALALLNYGDLAVDVAGEFVFTLDQALAAPSFQFQEAAERARLNQERAAEEAEQR